MTEQILRAHSSCRAQRGGAAVILTDTNDLETRPFGSPARPTSRASGWGRQEAGSAGRSEYRGGLACVGATGEFRLPRGGGMRSSSLAHTRGGDSSSQEAHPQRPPLGALGFRGHAPASASQGLVFLSGSARPSFPRVRQAQLPSEAPQLTLASPFRDAVWSPLAPLQLTPIPAP